MGTHDPFDVGASPTSSFLYHHVAAPCCAFFARFFFSLTIRLVPCAGFYVGSRSLPIPVVAHWWGLITVRTSHPSMVLLVLTCRFGAQTPHRLSRFTSINPPPSSATLPILCVSIACLFEFVLTFFCSISVRHDVRYSLDVDGHSADSFGVTSYACRA